MSKVDISVWFGVGAVILLGFSFLPSYAPVYGVLPSTYNMGEAVEAVDRLTEIVAIMAFVGKVDYQLVLYIVLFKNLCKMDSMSYVYLYKYGSPDLVKLMLAIGRVVAEVNGVDLGPVMKLLEGILENKEWVVFRLNIIGGDGDIEIRKLEDILKGRKS